MKELLLVVKLLSHIEQKIIFCIPKKETKKIKFITFHNITQCYDRIHMTWFIDIQYISNFFSYLPANFTVNIVAL